MFVLGKVCIIVLGAVAGIIPTFIPTFVLVIFILRGVTSDHSYLHSYPDFYHSYPSLFLMYSDEVLEEACKIVEENKIRRERLAIGRVSAVIVFLPFLFLVFFQWVFDVADLLIFISWGCYFWFAVLFSDSLEMMLMGKGGCSQIFAEVEIVIALMLFIASIGVNFMEVAPPTRTAHLWGWQPRSS